MVQDSYKKLCYFKLQNFLIVKEMNFRERVLIVNFRVKTENIWNNDLRWILCIIYCHWTVETFRECINSPVFKLFFFNILKKLILNLIKPYSFFLVLYVIAIFLYLSWLIFQGFSLFFFFVSDGFDFLNFSMIFTAIWHTMHLLNCNLNVTVLSN